MDIKIVDVSQMKKSELRYEIQPAREEKCTITKTPMELLPKVLPKDMVSCEEISCERTKKGMTDNCSICQNINNDIFIKCQTKFK